jgi:uncharacterized membrane protein YccC
VGARLPASPPGLTGPQLPARPRPRPGRSARRISHRLRSDLREGRGLVAGELGQSGWLDFGAFRWRDLAGSQAIRAAIGVMTPLVIGVLTGRTSYGSYAALGALPAGFVAFRGVNRSRVLAVLAAAIGMAVSTFVGATAAAELPWILMLVVFIWAYVIGLLASLGPTVLAVALQWPVALLIASALPLAPGPAAVRAGLVLAGGLWQCLLVISSWTIHRGTAERTALAGSYQSLADYAAHVGAGQPGPPEPGPLTGSRVLADPNPLMRSAARQNLHDLVAEAERIRDTLGALSAACAAAGEEPDPEAANLLAVSAAVLREVAGGLGGRPALLPDLLEEARRQLRMIAARPGTAWQWAADALLGQLRSAIRITERLGNSEQPASASRTPPLLRPHQVADAWLTVRASVGVSSEAGRHALRLAVVTTVAEVLVLASGLAHGYWTVLTIFIVLRPDYSSTLQRGLQRAAGTAIGAGLGFGTVQLGHLGSTALLVGIGVTMLAAYAVFTVNYLLYAVFLTDFVVILLHLLGLPAGPTAIYRLIGTCLGTGLAVLAYLFWPTWEGTSAAEKFALLASAQGEYAAALLRAYSRGPQSARLGQLQLTARRARQDAEASADRLAGEPEHPPMRSVTAQELASASHRIALACLALGAVVAAHHAGPPPPPDPQLQPDLDELADGVELATGQLSAALRSLDPASPQPAAGLLRLPPLRAQQRAVWADLGGPAAGQGGPGQQLPGGPDGEPGESSPWPDNEETGLLTATDGLVDAINTAAFILRQ